VYVPILERHFSVSLHLSTEIPVPAVKELVVAKLRTTEPDSFATRIINLSGLIFYACEDDLKEDINPIETVVMPPGNAFWAKLTLRKETLEYEVKCTMVNWILMLI
jgi:hypothetical protein